ncbi:MAG TPA: peptide-methionine (R)-S-oxide reductase MsrB [Candidatus Saccharimonadales bacterium]
MDGKGIGEEEWRKRLSPEQYRVLREKDTEAPYSGALLYNDQAGTYACGACGTPLFDSDTKFDAHCGWPSFYDAKPGAVSFNEDTSHNMVRTEVVCATCGSHLGHVFPDAPTTPTGQRYCINSLSLAFKQR